jgi:hypothetical protein
MGLAVLDYVRSKDERFKSVPDDDLIDYIGNRAPEFLQDKEFKEAFDQLQARKKEERLKPVPNPESLRPVVFATVEEETLPSGLGRKVAPTPLVYDLGLMQQQAAIEELRTPEKQAEVMAQLERYTKPLLDLGWNEEDVELMKRVWPSRLAHVGIEVQHAVVDAIESMTSIANLGLLVFGGLPFAAENVAVRLGLGELARRSGIVRRILLGALGADLALNATETTQEAVRAYKEGNIDRAVYLFTTAAIEAGAAGGVGAGVAKRVVSPQEAAKLDSNRVFREKIEEIGSRPEVVSALKSIGQDIAQQPEVQAAIKRGAAEPVPEGAKLTPKTDAVMRQLPYRTATSVEQFVERRTRVEIPERARLEQERALETAVERARREVEIARVSGDEELLLHARERASALELQRLRLRRELEPAERPSQLRPGEPFPEPGRPTPGFLETAEQRLARRRPPPERGVEVPPERPEGKPLRSLEEILQEKLAARDLEQAAFAAAQMAERQGKVVTRRFIDHVLETKREPVPLSAAERIIFEQEWEAAIDRLGGRPRVAQERTPALTEEGGEILGLQKEKGQVEEVMKPSAASSGAAELRAQEVAKAQEFLSEPGRVEKIISDVREIIRPKPDELMEGVTGAPVWVTKAIFNSALDAFEAAWKQRKSIADAIEAGMEVLRKAPGFKKELHEREAREWLESVTTLGVVSDSLLQRAQASQAQQLALQNAAKINPIWRSVLPLIDIVSAPGNWAFKYYSDWMLDGIALRGGPVAKRIQALGKHSSMLADKTKGEMRVWLDPVLRKAGELGEAPKVEFLAMEPYPIVRTSSPKFPNVELQKVHKLDIPNVDYVFGVNGFFGRAEYGIKLSPAAETRFLEYSDANLKMGQFAEPIVPGFKATGLLQRNFTREGLNLIQRAATDPARQDYIKALAYVNNVSVAKVDAMFARMKELLDMPAPDPVEWLKINQEFHRFLPRAITHVKVKGSWAELIHSTPFDYFARNAERLQKIAGFRNTFGGADVIRAFGKELSRELSSSDMKLYWAAMRDLQGLPVDAKAGLDLNWSYTAFNIWQWFAIPYRALVLGANFFTNLPETIWGAPTIFNGLGSVLKALFKARELYPLLEQRGLVERHIYNNSFDPASPISSVVRITGNAITRAFFEQILNYIQAYLAAASAYLKLDAYRKGKLSPRASALYEEAVRVVLGADDAEMARFRAGEQAITDEYLNRIGPFSTGGSSAPGQKSYLGASQWFNEAVWFQPYPMARINQTRRLLLNLADAIESGDAARRTAAISLLSRFFVGITAQGVMSQFIAAWVASGFDEDAFEYTAREAIQKPGRFLLESMAFAYAGPLYFIFYQAQRFNLDKFWRDLAYMMPPVRGVADVIDAVAGHSNIYQGLSLRERMDILLFERTPAGRLTRFVAAMVGLSELDTKLMASVRTYKQWRAEVFGYSDVTETPGTLSDKADAEFRGLMRKALKDFEKTGQLPTDVLEQAILASYEGHPDKDPADRVIRSLQARKLLRTPKNEPLTPEQIEMLKDRLGEEGYQILVWHDAKIQQLIEAYKSRRRKK